MPKFNGLMLTRDGAALMAKAMATEAPTVITRIAVGDGEIGPDVPMFTMTEMAHEVQSITDVRKKVVEDSVVQLELVINTSRIGAGFFFRELGVFAQDPDEGEILYAYENVGAYADYMPAFGGATVVRRTVRLWITVGNATSVVFNTEASNTPSIPDIYTPGNLYMADDDGNLSDSGVLATKLPKSQANRLLVYVDPAGDDLNTGASASTPMRTLQGVIAKYGGVQPVSVQFAAGSYAVGALNITGNYALYGVVGAQDTVVLNGRFVFSESSVAIGNLTMRYASPASSRGVVELHNSNATIQQCVVDAVDRMGIGIFPYSASSVSLYMTAIQNAGWAVRCGMGCTVGMASVRIENTNAGGLWCVGSVMLWGSDTSDHYNHATTARAIGLGGAISMNGVWVTA